jgi:CBS domain containing-hemolysin-like protein
MEIFSEHIYTLECMLVLLCMSAFFSGTETAMFSLSRLQLAELRKSSSRTSKAIIFLLDNPSKLLVTILLGNLGVNVLFFCTSAMIVGDLGKKYGHFYQFASGLAVLALVIVFGEILPKAMGVTYSLGIARISSVPIMLWGIVATPIRIFFSYIAEKLEPKPDEEPRVNADELKFLLNISQAEGNVNAYAGEMIEDIVELSSLKIMNIMLPRTELALCPCDMKISDAIAKARDLRFFYLLVYGENEEDIKGIADIKDLCLAPEKDAPLKNFLKPIRFVPETQKAGKLLDEMIKDKQHLVIAVDEYGGIAGLVTYKGILEAAVGDMDDEFAEPEIPPVELLGPNEYRIRGDLSTSAWKDFFGREFRTDPDSPLYVTTVGGFVTYLLDRLPKKNDTVEFMNLKFTVEKVGKRRIETVILKVLP